MALKRSLLFVSSTLLWSLPPERWFEIAAEEGLGGVEVWTQHLESCRVPAETVRSLSRRYGLTVTVHNYSWDMNLISLSRPMRRRAVALTKRGIELAAYWHSPHVTIHPGRDGLAIPGADFDCELAESFRMLSRYAEERGTRASFEIMEKIPKERLTSSEAALRVESLAKETPSWGYTADVAHCDSLEELYTLAETLKGRIFEFHVSNKRGTVRHIAEVESGGFPLREVAEKLSDYGKPMALEGFDPSPDADRFYRTLALLGGQK